MARLPLARAGVAALAIALSVVVAPAAGAQPTATPSTTAPASWNGSSYVSSASGTVSTSGGAAAAPTPPLTQVPAGAAPTDRLEVAAEVLLAAVAAAGVGLGYELRRVRRARRQPGRHSATPVAAPGRRPRSVVLVAAAIGAVVPAAPVAMSAAAGAAPAPEVVVSTATGEVSTGPALLTGSRGPDAGVGQPLRVAIPSLGVDAPVMPAAVDRAGTMQVPVAPTTVGWWAAGPVPGAATGTAVLASHVQYGATEGAFGALSLLRPGATVVVRGAEGAQSYTVTSVATYPKSALPAASLFTATGPGRLALVTCGGPFNRLTGHFEDQVVALASPSGAPSSATAG